MLITVKPPRKRVITTPRGCIQIQNEVPKHLTSKTIFFESFAKTILQQTTRLHSAMDSWFAENITASDEYGLTTAAATSHVWFGILFARSIS